MGTKRFVSPGLAVALISPLIVGGLVGCSPDRRQRPPTPSGRTFYVSPVPDCSGRTPCFATVQEAVDAAAAAGDVIKVASGVYTSTAPQVVAIERAVRLVGGHDPVDWSRSSSEDSLSVLDAGQTSGRRCVSIDGEDAGTITVAGFWIRHGGAQGSGGGGVHVAGGSVVLEGNVVEACTAHRRGGGVFVGGGDVHLRDNTLRDNWAQYGGALYVEGGHVVLDRNTFMHNRAPPAGGAIGIGGGTVEGANNVVADNPLCGAGVYLSGGFLTATHWTLAANGRYGVIVDLGLDIDSGSVTLEKSIVASHGGGLCGAGAVAHQTLFHEVERPCIAGASCVDNLFGDPRFSDPRVGDYHISPDSDAVDRGYSVDVGHDMDGDPRPIGRASDIGADEVGGCRTFLPFVVRTVSGARP